MLKDYSKKQQTASTKSAQSENEKGSAQVLAFLWRNRKFLNELFQIR